MFGDLPLLNKPWSKHPKDKCLGPVVQSIISLTSSLRGQLCFTTLYPNTLIFFVEKIREAFAWQKLLTFFHQKKKKMAYFRY